MFLKICGLTRLTDALHATAHGATALGFVFWPRSPRYVTPERAGEIIAELPPTIVTVGVFVNEPIDAIARIVGIAGVTAVQLHGDEPPAYAGALSWPVLRSATVDELMTVAAAWPEPATLLVDAADPKRRGGTGATVDWKKAAAVAGQRRLVLAGGLTPLNVAEAIAIVQPYGVDVSSGVEAAPGVKDFAKVTRFLANARTAFDSRKEKEEG
jgi:phosphoribosylanthranilate isomerase